MFSKLKIKRFNEEVSCAPPPTKYAPKIQDTSSSHSLDRSDRWHENKECTPAPTAYLGHVFPRISSTITPTKKGRSSSTTRLNSSTASTTSASSHPEFLSPSQINFPRSKSFRSANKNAQEELRRRVKQLEQEKKAQNELISQLEQQLTSLRSKENEAVSKASGETKFCDSSTQIDFEANKVSPIAASEPSDQPEDLSCPKKREREKKEMSPVSISAEELQLLRDQIDHLTSLRDNLECSVKVKEDAVVDLQIQIDLIVVDAEKSHDGMQMYKQQNETIRKKLEKTLEDQKMKECRVKDLVSRYEALTRTHQATCRNTKDIIAQKDIEIELLNDSIATLNTQVSEYERTVSRIQTEVSLKRSQISKLEMTVGDLSIASKEKEFMETMLADELDEKDKEMSKLEVTLQDVETKLKDMQDDREKARWKLEDVLSMSQLLKEQLKGLEVTLKEKEVVQQFLEKEVASREAEVNDSTARIMDLEKELETARKVATDLQLEAELQLNQVFCLKASLSAKDYDLESKDELIDTLKEEVTQKETECETTYTELTDETDRKRETILSLEENICTLKSALDKEEENTYQLEERVVQLMVEIGDREAEYKKRLVERDSEIEELSVKYSDALLEQETTKRLVTATSEKLEKEKLLLEATERELEAAREELGREKQDYNELHSESKELSHKLMHIEDALACEEAESREIQRRLENTEKHLEKALRENEGLQSSNEGYTGQIAMLKIGMTKKSLAVEEMQLRIDELRDEKNILIEDKVYLCEEKTLLNATLRLMESSLREKGVMLQDLQNEFEGRLQSITSLQVELEKKEVEMEEMKVEVRQKARDEELRVIEFEEEKSVFFNQISLLENHLREERDQKVIYKTKAMEMEDRSAAIEEEKQKAISSLQSKVKREKTVVEGLQRRLDEMDAKYECYEDQLINMQTSLTDKTDEADRLSQYYSELNLTTESYKEKIEELKSDMSKLAKESDQLSDSLASKDNLLSSLNDSVSGKSDEIQNLHKNLEAKQSQLCSLELRMHEMEKTVTSLKEERDRATSRAISLQESLDVTREELNKTNVIHNQEQEEKVRSLVADHERLVKVLTTERKTVQQEALMWRNKFEYLEKMIEPFREQLDSFEVEKSALLSKSSAAAMEVTKLSEEYAKLLGHNNHKQKIQHVVKLKTENNQLKGRVLKLQAELEKQKKAVRRLEEKSGEPSTSSLGGALTRGRSFVASKTSLVLPPADPEDKENSSPQFTSTPLRSSSLSNRFRRL